MELTYGPEGNVLPLSINRPAIETAVVGGVKLPKGAVQVDKDELDTLEAHDTAVCEALDAANDELEEVREELNTVKSQLAAAKATSLLGEHTLFPLNTDGVSTPPEDPDCFCYIVFPNMRRRVLICNLPVNAGETLRFGDLDSVGYSVVIERRAKASPIPGGKPSMGFFLSIENRAGQNCDLQFVPDHMFHERLSDHEKDPIYMGGQVFRGTFQMKRYKSYPDALAMLLQDEMIELLKRKGWSPPPEKKPESSGPALTSGSATSGVPQLEQSASSTAPAAPPASKPSVAPPPPPPTAPAQNGARTKDKDVNGAEDRTDELGKHLEPADPETAEALRRLAEEDAQRHGTTGTAVAG